MEATAYTLSDKDREKIRKIVDRRKSNPYTLEYSENPKAEGTHSLPVLRKVIRDFMSSNREVLLIKNCPIGHMGPTPLERWVPPQKDNFISEKFMLAVGFSLGTPFTLYEDNGGYLIHNIHPVKRLESVQCANSSKVFLTVHTEWSCFQEQPDFLMLLGVRETGEDVKTPLLSFKRLKKFLTKGELEILKTESFVTEIDVSVRNLKKEKYSQPFAIYKGNDRWQYDVEYTHGIDEKSEKVIKKIARLLPRLYEDQVIKFGDLLIINNYKVAHARREYRPRFDGTDRWIQRMFVYKNGNKRNKTVYSLDELLLKT